MSDPSAEPEPQKKKRSLIPLLIGLVLAAAGGAGGFLMMSAGLPIGGGDTGSAEATPEVAFVPLDPLTISLGQNGLQRHLRFHAQLEVAPGNETAVIEVLPRVADVLNGYLRAVELSDIEDPASLVRLRAQMLRRIQIVVGEGLVSDLLVTEFVLS